MISKVCFNAIADQTENSIDDIFNGGFLISFIPKEDYWKVNVELEPYYWKHDGKFEITFELKEQALHQFAYSLRLEEVGVMEKQSQVVNS